MWNGIHCTKIVVKTALLFMLVNGCAPQPPAATELFAGPRITERFVSEVNWKNVEDDFSGSWFCERTIHLPTWSIKTLGMEPAFQWHIEDAVHRMDVWLFVDNCHNQNYLYVINFKERWYAFEMQSLASFIWGTPDFPTFEELLDALWDGSLAEPLPLDRLNCTFVSSQFWEEVTEKGIQLPETFIQLNKVEAMWGCKGCDDPDHCWQGRRADGE